MNYRFEVVVEGKVQGVFFRKTTSEKAAQLGLTGWVKNLPNGSVKFQCQGYLEMCFSLISWAQGGPPMAEPGGLTIVQIDDLEEAEKEFKILY